MPDKKLKGAVAVEEEEEPAPLAGPAAPEAPEVLGEPEEEPVPEQEPSEEEESGAGEEEAEEEPDAARIQLKDRLRELLQDDPELESELYEDVFSQELRDRNAGPEAEREQLDRERAQHQVEDARQAAQTEYYTSLGTIDTGLKAWAKEMAENVAKAAEDAGVENPQLLDGDKIAQDTGSLMQVAMNVMSTYVSRTASNRIIQTLEGHEAFRHLSADDKKKLTEAGGKSFEDWVGVVLPVYLDAAIRAAPEKVQKEADARAEKKLGVTQKIQGVLDSLGTGDGRKATKGATSITAPKKSGYKNMTDEERAKLTPEVIDAMTAKIMSEAS